MITAPSSLTRPVVIVLHDRSETCSSWLQLAVCIDRAQDDLRWCIEHRKKHEREERTARICMGSLLRQIKAQVPHGDWLQTLARINMNSRTVQCAIKMAEDFAGADGTLDVRKVTRAVITLGKRIGPARCAMYPEIFSGDPAMLNSTQLQIIAGTRRLPQRASLESSNAHRGAHLRNRSDGNKASSLGTNDDFDAHVTSNLEQANMHFIDDPRPDEADELDECVSDADDLDDASENSGDEDQAVTRPYAFDARTATFAELVAVEDEARLKPVTKSRDAAFGSGVLVHQLVNKTPMQLDFTAMWAEIDEAHAIEKNVLDAIRAGSFGLDAASRFIKASRTYTAAIAKILESVDAPSDLQSTSRDGGAA